MSANCCHAAGCTLRGRHQGQHYDAAGRRWTGPRTVPTPAPSPSEVWLKEDQNIRDRYAAYKAERIRRWREVKPS